MQIRTYDEVDPYDVYRLSMAAFGFPATPKYLRSRIRKDPHVLDGFAIYAVERGRAVAQVVPLAMPVRLTTGVETVGGIQAVSSLTSVWGKGYVRQLMAHAHDMYRDLGIRIATLMTSRNMRGYRIYQKMGYVDLARFERGARRLPARRRMPRTLRLRRPTRRELPRIQELYDAYVAGMTGWTQRDPGRVAMQVSWNRSVLEQFRLAVRDGAAVGYMRIEPGTEGAIADEAVFPHERDFRLAVRVREAKETHPYASVIGITSARDRSRYRAVGYDLYTPMQLTVMALPLRSGMRPRDLPRAFGVPQGRFVLLSTDHF